MIQFNSNTYVIRVVEIGAHGREGALESKMDAYHVRHSHRPRDVGCEDMQLTWVVDCAEPHPSFAARVPPVKTHCHQIIT